MTIKGDGRGEATVVNRWEGGLTWMAHPDESMQRASHALVLDDDVWLVDPVDAENLDDVLAGLGDVAGVVVTSSWHSRDADTIANRHEVAVHLHERHGSLATKINAPLRRFGDGLAETGFRSFVIETTFWTEVGLFHPDRGTLVVGDSLVTREDYTASNERLAVLPVYRRIAPPRGALGDIDVDRVLVGHGVGVHERADDALDEALAGARRNAPELVVTAGPAFLRSSLLALLD